MDKVKDEPTDYFATVPLRITLAIAVTFCAVGCFGLVTGIFSLAFWYHPLNVVRVAASVAMISVGSYIFSLPTPIVFSFADTRPIFHTVMYVSFLAVATLGLSIGIFELNPALFTAELLARLSIYTACLAVALVFHPFPSKIKQA
jgi:hypothetical protein